MHRDNIFLLIAGCVMWGLIVMLLFVASDRGFDRYTIILWIIFSPFISVTAFGVFRFWRK